MTTPSSKSLERTPSIAGPIEQLYVMHCLKEDSVLGQEGFSVRASSPGANDAAILEWALRLDYYELPLDMKSGTLLVNQAPRRLARVPGPPGRVALVHTTYLPQDTVGRSHSFLSHIAILPELPDLAAVAAWGSTEWQTTEYPRGDSKVLSPLDRLPRGTLIDEAALKGFLASGAAPQDQSLARSIYPSRVESNPQARRRWVRAALHGFLKAGEPSSRKARLCILAEPGAVALLIYAIARLLPERIAGAFPFSTYEPHYTSLRDNKVARVIGSFARNGLDRGDLESLRRRGYVLDTLRNDDDPDLAVAADWPLEGIITLAAEGNWKGVDEIRELWSRDPRIAPGVSATVLGEALRVRPLAAALKSGTLGPEGLLELRRNHFAAGLLREDEFRRPTWEAVRKVWLQPVIRHEFADLFREHTEELLAEVTGLVESGPPGAWREAWEALKPVIPAERRLDDFSKLLAAMEHTGAALPAGERANLLVDWCQAAPAIAVFPTGLHWLLHAGSAEAFRTLLASSKVSTRLAGVATCLALCGGADWSAEPAFLGDLPDDQFHAFATALPGFENRKSVYDRLKAARGSSKVLVDRLVRLRSRLPESCVEDVLSALNCDEAAWHDYWLKGGGANFAAMLAHVASDSGLARRIWQGLLGRMTPENFADGEASGIDVFAEIARRYPNSLSRDQQERLESWNAITQAFVSPDTKMPAAERAANLASACRAANVKREDLAAQWFDTHILTASSPADLKKKSEQFGRALLGLFETEDAAAAQALKLANGVEKREQRRKCTSAMFQAIVSGENHDRLALKFESLLRETDIRPAPDVDLLQRGKPRGSTGKGIGIGPFRLSPQGTRNLLTFVGGATFALLLMLVLFPLVTQVGNWLWPSNELNQTVLALDVAKKAERALSARIKEKDEGLANMQNQLDSGKAEIRRLAGELKSAKEQHQNQLDATGSDARPQTGVDNAGVRRTPVFVAGTVTTIDLRQVARGAPTKNGSPKEAAGPGRSSPTGGDNMTRSGIGAGTPSENAALIRNLLDVLVIDRPIAYQRDIARSLELVKQAEQMQIGDAYSARLRLVRRLLTGLTFGDLPIDPGAAKLTTDDSHTDLAFLSGNDGRSVLATIRNHVVPLNLYFFETNAGGLSWKAKVPTLKERTPNVLTASLSGRTFLAGRKTDDRLDNLRIYTAKNLYELVYQKDRLRRNIIPDEERTISLQSETSAKLAVTDVDRYALAGPAGVMKWPPGVTVESSGGNALAVDLKAFNDLVEGEPVISAMTFDYTGHILIIGFRNSKQLPVFELANDKLNPVVLPKYPHDVRAWAHGVHGNLAVATDRDVFVGEIVHTSDTGTFESVTLTPPVPLKSRSSPGHLTCVAFSPKGSIVATGDENGAIAIRPLDRSNEGGEILRLGHIGPIQKLAFSPDGRVLAALASRPDAKDDSSADDKSKVHPGVIRLWVTEGWERTDQVRGQSGAAVAPDAK